MNNVIKAIRLAGIDDVATLLADTAKGDLIEVVDEKNNLVGEYTALQAIPFGNKMALHKIENQQLIHKASYEIGVAITSIEMGDLVHVQNVRSTRIDIPKTIIQQIIQQMKIEC